MNLYADRYDDYGYSDLSRSSHRRPDPGRKQKTAHKTVKATLTEVDDTIESFVPTYAAALDRKHHERRWVIASLGSFYQNDQINDVLRIVKAGKEANVYCCTGGTATGRELLAAKLYRPRMLRHLKNNAIYKEGRTQRGDDGKEIRGSRELRAMDKKTEFGAQLEITAWIENEFQTQRQLYAAGADVPAPVAHAGNTILMDYLGDAVIPAPTLIDVALPHKEANQLFDRLFHNIKLLLGHHLIHGDLSPYNILYWEGKITIIDFPQTVDARVNPNAYTLLERDVWRVGEYFARFGVKANFKQMAFDLWQQYMTATLSVKKYE